MTLTAKHVETVLRSVPGAYGNQRASMADLASGADAALRTAPAGLTVQGAAAFLATMSQESGSFRYLTEAGSSSYLKGKSYYPFVGRTFEQVTHRSNYAEFGAWCHALPLDHPGYLADPNAFVATPSLLSDIRWAWLGGVWFWQKNGIWAYGNRGNFLATQRAVNLGSPTSKYTPAGMAARSAWYAAWLKVGSELLPTTTEPTPPPEAPVMHSDRWNSDYVSFRGGYVPPVVRDILLAIPSPVQLSQGGLSSAVAASAHTHVGLGAYDVRVAGWSKDQITKLCRELISCGECAFPRGPRWGSPSFAEHVHVASNNAYHSLHPEAQAQVRDFKHSPRRNGLVNHAAYVGPSTPLGKWSDSPWNPVNIKAAADAAAKKKELELPTVQQVSAELATDKAFLAAVAKAVINTDGAVPNTFTGNPANADVAVATALQYLGSRTKKAEDTLAEINAKLDALSARFPGPPAA